MSLKKFCNKNVITIQSDADIKSAAALMNEHNIGCLVVIDKQQIPCGMLTDRDIVTRLFKDNIEMGSLKVNEVMSRDLLTVKEEQRSWDAIQVMKEKGVRRAPIVDAQGKLCGMVTVDDLLVRAADKLHNLSAIVSNQIN